MTLPSTLALAGALTLAPSSEPPAPALAPDDANEVPREDPGEVPREDPDAALEQVIPEPAGDYVIVETAPPMASGEPAPPPVEFRAGAMIMTRAEFRRARTVDGESTPTTVIPNRLRAKLEAKARDVRAYAEFQEARNLGDPIGAPRTGFHQLFGEYDAKLRRADVLVRLGRQEYGLGTRHLFWIAPWGARMRSWDGARVTVDAPRGGVELFAGSLARPLLSSSLRLVDHIAASQALTWVVNGYVRAHEALVIEALVTGGHERDASQTRHLVTTGLHLHGELAPGLRYDAEGHVQLGTIEVGRAVIPHLAGSAFAELDYLTPEPVDPHNKLRLGATATFDFMSGSDCDSDSDALDDPSLPCSSTRSADYHSPWMARHRWYGWADRFWGGNVIDAALAVRSQAQITDDLRIDLQLVNHLFAFPEPGGPWRNTGGTLIGIDPDNDERLAAHEVDVEGGLRFREWLSFDIGWHVVTSLAGGRAVSGLAQWQRVYVQIVVDF